MFSIKKATFEFFLSFKKLLIALAGTLTLIKQAQVNTGKALDDQAIGGNLKKCNL